ncbi:hypothetical protein [Anabaena sp. UHCC 0204]|uniref:hypothetical protein n=1 Tax=Anabaena sp. UHCC 0204 TaxID=2590009 RepID=UPI001446797E|nr:hypothetical protein [Anabaena sp. UHCC 0204]MTJ06812.1 hypothetical protein [Anabaena sp. UHCC 0204]
MIDKNLSTGQKNKSTVKAEFDQIKFQNDQNEIYSFLLTTVKQEIPEKTLLEFKRLFIESLRIHRDEDVPETYKIFSTQQEQEFHNTIKRCCYILVNNWEPAKHYKYIQDLLGIFTDYQRENQVFISPFIYPYSIWLNNFINSRDYEELKIFTNRSQEDTPSNWINRYSAYLLFAQSCDDKNPPEQRNAARKVAKQIREKFKFELAMYVAHSHSSDNYSNNKYKNPSMLGDDVLRLIKIIVSKKGSLSYENIANIFVQQTQKQRLGEYKENIQKYLLFSAGDTPAFIKPIQQHLRENLSEWKAESDEEIIDKGLVLRICNRIIDILTTENSKEPALLFKLLMSQGHSLTLVILLIKIILISSNSRTHLEIRISQLISYYEKYPVDECQWLINFLEIFNITFAIYAGNIEYSLINMKDHKQTFHVQANLNDYRVFSQLKLDAENK